MSKKNYYQKDINHTALTGSIDRLSRLHRALGRKRLPIAARHTTDHTGLGTSSEAA